MTFGRLAHSMAVNVDVIAGQRNLSIVEHREGNPVQVLAGSASVNLRAGDCFLLPPDRPYHAAWNSVAVTVTTLGFENLQRDAAWLVDHDTVNVEFTRPITRAAGRHWSQTVRYVQRVVSGSTLLVAAPLARRELGWPPTVQSWRASPTQPSTRTLPPTPGTRRNDSVERSSSPMSMQVSRSPSTRLPQPPSSVHVVYRPHSDAISIRHHWFTYGACGWSAPVGIWRTPSPATVAAWPQWPLAGGSPTLDVSLLSTAGDSAYIPVRRYAANAFPSSGIQLAAGPSTPAVSPHHQSWFGCRGRLAAAC
jgi:hypothetical protein